MIQLDSGNSQFNTAIGFVCGILGGCLKFVLTSTNMLMIFAMLQAMLTALLCGAAGVAGKELWTKRKGIYKFVVKKITRKKNNHVDQLP